MGEKITQAMALEVWNIDSPAAMSECLQELVEQDFYRGAVHCEWVLEPVVLPEGEVPEGQDPPAPERVAHWYLEINSDDKPSVLALVGQVVVLFGGVLEAMTTEAYASRFGTSNGEG